ncbi:hypothetical protein SGRIM128S_09027 [Streptomyces griseomycini]
MSLPLLPGHGTHWKDLRVTGWQDWYAEVDRELRLLRDRSARVFVAGLSMGGALALRLAALHGDAVSGVVVVNPANKVHGVAAHALPMLDDEAERDRRPAPEQFLPRRPGGEPWSVTGRRRRAIGPGDPWSAPA